MMIHAAIKNQELLASRDFDIVDPGQINSGFANEKTARLNKEMRAGKIGIGFNFGEECCEPGPDVIKVEIFLVSKVGNPKAPAKIHGVQRRARSTSGVAGDGQAVPVLTDESARVKNLRAGKDM